jgi:hypothetical protein
MISDQWGSDQLGKDAARLEAAARSRLSPDDPSLRDLFARRPEWTELLAAYGQSGDLSQEKLARFHAAAEREDELLVRELVAEASQRYSFPAARRLRRHWSWGLLAAGLLLGAGVALWWQTNRVPSDRQLLGPAVGNSGLSCSAPVGAVADFGEFRWQSEQSLRTSQAYLVSVYSVSADGTPGALLDQERVRDMHWSAPAERTALWPDRIRWTVTLVEEGFERGSASASAERSPH